MPRTLSAACALWMLSAACQRDFAEPPPIPTIVSLDPESGFMGDRVVIGGTNFDADPEKNLVFFGTETAAVLSGGEAPTSTLIVEVPSLEPGEEVTVKVSTPMGQATSPGKFRCLGPGHPVAERLGRELRIEWSPVAVAPLGRIPAAADQPLLSLAVVANATSRTLSMVSDQGFHVDYGLRDMPVSLAMHIFAEDDVRYYATTVRVDPQSLGILESELHTIVVTADPGAKFPQLMHGEPLLLPELDDGLGFQPAHVWAVCREGPDLPCQDPVLAMSDLLRPLLLVVDPRTGAELSLHALGKLPCTEMQLAPVADLRYDRDGRRFLVALKERPEILSVPDADEVCPAPVWPAGDDNPAWGHKYTAIEALGGFLYAADAASNTLLQIDLGEGVPQLRQSLPLFGTAYSMTLARAVDVFYLYVATENALLAFQLDPTDVVGHQLLLAQYIPMPGSRGGPQSLATLVDPSGTDTVLFADTVRESVRFYTPGGEWDTAAHTTIGASFPQIANSRFSDTLYFTDPLLNTVRLLDRTSGIQSDQIVILGQVTYGSMEMTCVEAGGSDVILVPLPPDLSLIDPARSSFRSIAVLPIRSREALVDMAGKNYDLIDSAKREVLVEYDGREEQFNEMLPAVSQGRVYLVKYPQEGSDGRIWYYNFAPDEESGTEILTGVKGMGGPFGDLPSLPLEQERRTMLVRLSDRGDEMILLDLPEVGAPRLQIIPLGGNASDESIPTGLFARLTSDISLRKRPADPPASGRTIYLALAELGQVAVLLEDGSARFVETTGSPARLFLSPDGRRLYATHRSEGKVSVIDVDCDESPGCERVLGNITVNHNPAKVLFHPSGKAAFVTHTLGNIISEIE